MNNTRKALLDRGETAFCTKEIESYETKYKELIQYGREKMAGGFRKTKGHEMYCAILTIVETLKRRKMGIIENIKLLFAGTPAIF